MYDVNPSSIVDLACGTGSVTTIMAGRGFDMTGVDISSEMLSMAYNKAMRENADILYLNQDICAFELYGTVDAAICCLDGINYLTDKKNLRKCFQNLHLYLNPGGLLIFDINTLFKYENILSNNAFVYDYGDLFCIWQNTYDTRLKTCIFDITVFSEEGTGFCRYDERQTQRAYEMEELISLLSEAGFGDIRVFNAFTPHEPEKTSERIFFAARKSK
ncbi:Ubiquinone/menaquinone biosynthesis C-methyltransferase UbiE [bioreactor metagenome]|uniref:Ubiquinone/menaquinone biosynthesis C-methyltransferase UbiE n=1 Tax=bioreactor metagenome TaxID=1076179 RepID=A0A645GKK1_9ZZZZ